MTTNDQVTELRAALQFFIDRCDSGLAQSKTTYAKFKEVLARTERAATQPAGEVVKYTSGRWFNARTLDEMQAFYMDRLPAIREAAKEHGYAIGLHGSARRDFDLMAMQWRDGASDKNTLAHAIAMAACGITRDGDFEWEEKPSGRFAVSLPICWTDHGNPDFDKPSIGHIDLSIIAAPISEDTAKEALRTEVQLRGKIHMLNDEIEELKEQLAARTPASVGSEAKGEAAVSIGDDLTFLRLAYQWQHELGEAKDYDALVAYIDSRIAAAPERSGKAADDEPYGWAAWHRLGTAELCMIKPRAELYDRIVPLYTRPAGDSSAAPSDETSMECPVCNGSGEQFGSFACDECDGTGLATPAPTGESLSVPSGWQLVPAEPTEEMIYAGSEKLSSKCKYEAMLAAAPKFAAKESA